MTEEHTGASTRTSRVIGVRPEELYAAFLDPAALVDWLPPAEMTGEIHEFDARVGGGYRMSLFYPPTTSALSAARCPIGRTWSTCGCGTGEMTIIATFEEVSGGAEVTLVSNNLPSGLRAEDNEAGSRLSLEQLARRFELRI